MTSAAAVRLGALLVLVSLLAAGVRVGVGDRLVTLRSLDREVPPVLLRHAASEVKRYLRPGEPVLLVVRNARNRAQLGEWQTALFPLPVVPVAQGEGPAAVARRARRLGARWVICSLPAARRKLGLAKIRRLSDQWGQATWLCAAPGESR